MKTKIGKIINVLKALACETRFKIVVGLIDTRECNVNLIAEYLGIAQPNVSQHLAILKSAGIIEGYRNGAQICYRVVNQQAVSIIKALEIYK